MEDNKEVITQESLPQQPKKENKNFFSRKNIIILTTAFILGISLLVFLQYSNSTKLNNSLSEIDLKLQKSNPEEAIELSKKALDEFPNDKQLLTRQIDAYSSYGNIKGKEKEMLELSKPVIDNALKLYPNDFFLLISSGYAFETAGEYQLALNYYEKAILINPNSSMAHFHKSHVLAFLGRQNEANESLLKAYELDKKNALAAITIAQKVNSEGKYSQAIQILESVGNDEGVNLFTRAEAFMAAAYIEFGKNNIEKTKSYTENSLALVPEYSPALGLSGYILAFNAGSYKEGIDKITKAIELNPRISLNYFLLGLVMRAYGYNDKAVALQLEGLDKIGNDNTLVGAEIISITRSRMNYELGVTYAGLGNIDDSVKYLTLALDANSTYKNRLEQETITGVFDKVKSNSKFVSLSRL